MQSHPDPQIISSSCDNSDRVPCYSISNLLDHGSSQGMAVCSHKDDISSSGSTSLPDLALRRRDSVIVPRTLANDADPAAKIVAYAASQSQSTTQSIVRIASIPAEILPSPTQDIFRTWLRDIYKTRALQYHVSTAPPRSLPVVVVEQTWQNYIENAEGYCIPTSAVLPMAKVTKELLLALLSDALEDIIPQIFSDIVLGWQHLTATLSWPSESTRIFQTTYHHDRPRWAPRLSHVSVLSACALLTMLRADQFPAFPPDEDALEALEVLASAFRGGGRAFSPPQSPRISTGAHDSLPSANLRDLTHMAVWTVSTAKPGNGVEQILDRSEHTYWQSDGPQPHMISAQFASKLKVAEVQLYLDYGTDESYTPAVVSVQAGSNVHDLRLVRKLGKLEAPQGWVRIPMGERPQMCDEGSDEETSDREAEVGGAPEEEERQRERRHARAQRREKSMLARQEALNERQKRAEEGVNGRLEAMRDHSVTKAHMVRIVIHGNHLNGRDSHVRMVRALGPKMQIIGSASKFTSKEFQMHETIR